MMRFEHLERLGAAVGGNSVRATEPERRNIRRDDDMN